jgi:threonine dehydratase/serine racemase
MPSYAVDLETIRAAASRLTGIVHRTPVMTCGTIDRMAGRALFFKCENFQKAGAFKFRGASNAVLQVDAARASCGVVTHSSGNHAAALALAARMRGIPAYIVMPRTVVPVKRRAVEEYGGQVILCEPTAEARVAAAAEVVASTGATFISPDNHADVIAGQGTAALELLAEVPNLDAVIAPVGGGGLISGVCIATQGVNSNVRVFAAEPLGADDAARSKAAGKLILQTGPQTIADGLLVSLGDLTWPVIRDRVEAIVTVTEEEIIRTMRLTWERAKLLIEPSSAVAVAAVLTEGFRALPGIERVGVVLSGGNIELDRLPWIPAQKATP